MQKPLVAVIRGGYSGESVISHQSADRMMAAVDRDRYDAVFITISLDEWSCIDRSGMEMSWDRSVFTVGDRRIDAALIAIHGAPGEDGRLQGLLDMYGIPYQTGDHICMGITFSKYSTTALLRHLGFVVADSMLISRRTSIDREKLSALGLPLFVKPDRSGSSLGVTKVKDLKDLDAAVDLAFKEGDLVMVEKGVAGRELTCGVIDLNGTVQALPVCEIRTTREFFDYEAKYHSAGTEELVPAPIPDSVTRLVQQRSVAIYNAMNCRGMVRVDHFWTGGDDERSLITIELNTVPGFSNASIFPKMLEAAGIGVEAAINGMIAGMLALPPVR